jgi:glycosyltransferase involved in cell wall biosynthesis
MNVSVAISTNNSAKLLNACLARLLRQKEISSAEVIVIDSGSMEDELTVCHSYKGKFVRLIYERTDKETLYSAWNTALAKASGKYFMNANTDDSLHPGALQFLTKAMDDHPEAALAYGDWMWATVPNATYPWDSSFRRCVHSEYHPTLPLFYAYAGCHQFWRTDKLRELGGFNATYKAAGDYDALCRMALKRWHAVYIPEAVSAFYQNPNGISRSSGTSHREFHEIRDRFRSQVSIEDLYDVDSGSASACARAWTDLADRALSLHVPWAEQAIPDTDFAAQCVHKALDLDPTNQQAKDLLALSTKGWRGLIKRTWRSTKGAFTSVTTDRSPSPKARTPSPVFSTTGVRST